MNVLHSVIFLCTIGFALADVASVFEEAKIKPDLLDKVPEKSIEVNFGCKSANLGNELTPTEVKDLPEIHYQHKKGGLYTLIMTDPDVPSRETPTQREWHHWLVGNIPGEDISKGDVLTQFVSSAPSNNTGLHRYVFLIYEQPCKLEFDEQRLTNRSVEGRDHFSTKNFAAKYNLGDPIGGNFYMAQFDDYVPFVHEQLGL